MSKLPGFLDPATLRWVAAQAEDELVQGEEIERRLRDEHGSSDWLVRCWLWRNHVHKSMRFRLRNIATRIENRKRHE